MSPRPPICRVCIDENLPYPVAAALSRIWKRTRFDHVKDLNLTGVPDTELISELGHLSIDALLTGDKHMLVNSEERQALIAAGVSWIGLEVPLGLAGIGGNAYRIAAAIVGFRAVLAQWNPAPSGYWIPTFKGPNLSRVDLASSEYPFPL